MRFKILLTISIAILMMSFSNNKNESPKETTVYIFLSETCPICESYTLTLKELYKKYSDKNVKFIGVFPNYYADSDSIKVFKEKYSIPFDLILDKDAALTKRFGATITPEVFVENKKKEVLYSGRIDDTFYSLGRRRKVISSNELDDALNSIVNNEKTKAPKTQAVGCIISISK